MTTKTITTDRPIMLHGLCHVPDSFCDGIELRSIPYQNLVPEKFGTRLTDTCASFCYQTTGTSFCCVCRRLYAYYAPVKRLAVKIISTVTWNMSSEDVKPFATQLNLFMMC